MLKRIFIIHGWSGSPADDWFPWLKFELLKLGYEVVVPDMPNSDEPVIDEWIDYLIKLVGDVNEQTYFIGHSVGCQAILRYLEKIEQPIGGAIFVAGWFDLLNLEDETTEAIASPWINTVINLSKVKTLIPKSVLIISDNDPYNCFKVNQAKFSELGSNIVVLPGAGHITSDDGFKEAPIILEKFKEIS